MFVDVQMALAEIAGSYTYYSLVQVSFDHYVLRHNWFSAGARPILLGVPLDYKARLEELCYYQQVTSSIPAIIMRNCGNEFPPE